MAGYLLSGWDIARLGSFAVDVDDGTSSGTAEHTSGTYAHSDLSSVMGAGEYADFATDHATELDTVLTVTSTVSFSTSTLAYTIGDAADGTNVEFDFAAQGDSGRRLAQALGFDYQHADATGGSSSDPYAITLSGDSQYTSNVTPYYALALARDGTSDYEPPYEIAGQVKRASSSLGNGYAVRPTTREEGVDFRLAFQSQASVFTAEASATVPWTYEDLLDHAWAAEPILLHTSTLDVVYKNIEPLGFTKDSRRPVWSNYHAKWHLDVRAQYLGSL